LIPLSQIGVSPSSKTSFLKLRREGAGCTGMKPVLSPHERYLVVREKNGWAVNLGADALHVYMSRDDARRAAEQHVADAIAAGRSADWLDVSEDHPEGTA
jgi:hypothetical protein